jgi:mercuric ion binding protein
MKKQLSFIASFLLLSIFSFAQTKATTEKIKVWGDCGMCKETIEKAAKQAGASEATWDEDAKVLTVTYASSKTSSKKIQQKVAAAGYDTELATATLKAYKSLPQCCQYTRKPAEKKEEKKN